MGLPAPVWISLEEQDNDLAQFLQHLVTTCIEIDPHLLNLSQSLRHVEELSEKQVNRPALSMPGEFNSEDLLIDLINALAGLPREIALIMDEYHRIESPEVHQTVSFFINYLPENVHVYLASRGEPRLRIAHLRARREIIQIGPAELFHSSR